MNDMVLVQWLAGISRDNIEEAGVLMQRVGTISPLQSESGDGSKLTSYGLESLIGNRVAEPPQVNKDRQSPDQTRARPTHHQVLAEHCEGEGPGGSSVSVLHDRSSTERRTVYFSNCSDHTMGEERLL
jgi:hypothetical protein